MQRAMFFERFFGKSYIMSRNQHVRSITLRLDLRVIRY
jgi:hypothetical protein